MNNWYLKFLLLGFLALGVGLLAAWLTSFFTWMPNIQKGVGFLVAGIAVIISEILNRRKFDRDGVYHELYLLPFLPIRLPAWWFGVLIAIGGIVILASGE